MHALERANKRETRACTSEWNGNSASLLRKYWTFREGKKDKIPINIWTSEQDERLTRCVAFDKWKSFTLIHCKKRSRVVQRIETLKERERERDVRMECEWERWNTVRVCKILNVVSGHMRGGNIEKRETIERIVQSAARCRARVQFPSPTCIPFNLWFIFGS